MIANGNDATGGSPDFSKVRDNMVRRLRAFVDRLEKQEHPWDIESTLNLIAAEAERGSNKVKNLPFGLEP